MNFIGWTDKDFLFFFPWPLLHHQREREMPCLSGHKSEHGFCSKHIFYLFWLISIPEWHTNCIIIVYQNVICVEICKRLLTKDRDAEHRHKERKYCSRQRKKITIHYARNICNGSHSPAPSGSPAREADALTRRLNGCSLYSISR